MGKQDLIVKLSAIARAIRDYQNENGFPPSFRDVGDLSGISSSGMVNYYLQRGRERYWTYRDFTNRTLLLTSAGLRLAEGDGDA